MRAMRILVFLVATPSAAAADGSLIQSAPPKAAQRRNPFHSDEHAQRAGAKLYGRECASCHGDKREGRRNAPPLNRPDVQSAASGNLFWVLTNGSLHRGMPSFAHLPEAQRWQIVTFLKTGLNRADGR
jgi:mono/diheme cytochrome c family protein